MAGYNGEEFKRNKLELLGKLIVSLAHEIRNPLSAIKLNLDFLEMSKDELDEELIESIKHSQEAADRIKYIIENLLNFARDSKDEETNSLNFVAAQAVELTHVKARSKDVKLIKQFEQEAQQCLVHEKKILQVVINLLTNAIEACDEHGRVVIRTFSEKGASGSIEYFLTVEDNGVGIKEEDKERIFDDFFTTKESGTGLGLHVCKNILNEQNAKISFESKYGVGTKFIISFSKGGNIAI